MAYPQVASSATYESTAATVVHVINYPSSIVPGDFLVMVLGTPAVAATTVHGVLSANTTAEFNDCLMLMSFTSVSAAVSGTFEVSVGVAAQLAGNIKRITGNAPGVTPEFIFSEQTGADASADPAALDPAGWDPTAIDTLWLAACTPDTVAAGSNNIIGFPAGFTNTLALETAAVGGAATLGVAFLESNLASVDPGVFLLSASEQWVALTLALAGTAPAAGGQIHVPVIIQNFRNMGIQ